MLDEGIGRRGEAFPGEEGPWVEAVWGGGKGNSEIIFPSTKRGKKLSWKRLATQRHKLERKSDTVGKNWGKKLCKLQIVCCDPLNLLIKKNKKYPRTTIPRDVISEQCGEE